MLDVFIAESTAVLAYCEADSVAAGLIIGARVFGVESLDWVTTFYADGHCMYDSYHRRGEEDLDIV